MTNLTATPAWDDVPQLETVTQALGGPGGPMNSQAQALMNRSEYLKSRVVEAGQSVTLNVPAQYAGIQAALNAIANWEIMGTVTIQVADGTLSHTSGLNLNHPFGANIRILGNTATPANCILLWTSSNVDGIVASVGHTMPFIDGFTIKKNAKAVWPDNSIAILADQGAVMNVGANVKVDNWYYGVVWRHGSSGKSLASVDHAGDVGIWACYGSTGHAPGTSSTNASGTDAGAATLGFGFQAEHGSQLSCEGATASGCLVAGIAALSGSQVQAPGATSNSNTGSGFLAQDGGTIEAHGATANTNTRYGREQIGASRIIGNGFTQTGNTLGATKAVAYFDNNTLGPRILADADFRIDLSGAYSWFFNSSGGLQFSISNTVSSVNRLNATGGAAGSPPQLSASGSDTNIDILLTPKGTGNVRFGTLTTNADAPVTGYVTIKDSGGTTRKLAVIA